MNSSMRWLLLGEVCNEQKYVVCPQRLELSVVYIRSKSQVCIC